MLLKIAKNAGLLLISLVMASGLAMADVLNYTTGSGESDGPVPGINFSLSMVQIGDTNQYNATFTIASPSSDVSGIGESWSMGWFQFKFDGGVEGVISDPSDWVLLDDTDVIGWGNANLPTSTWSGLYAPGAIEPFSTASMVQVSGSGFGGGVTAFTFLVTIDPALLKTDDLPFQVGFYHEGERKVFTDRLSQDLKVPDGGLTVMLLGVGLGGLGLFARKFWQ